MRNGLRCIKEEMLRWNQLPVQLKTKIDRRENKKEASDLLISFAGSAKLDVLRRLYRSQQRRNRRILYVSSSLEYTHTGLSGAICDCQRVLLHRGESCAAATLSS